MGSVTASGSPGELTFGPVKLDLGWSLPYGERPSSGRRSYNVAKLSRVCGEGQRFALPQTDAYLDCVGGVPEWRRCPAGFFFDAGTKSCTPANSRNPGSTRKSYQSQSSPFPENRRGMGVSSADRRSRPSFEKQERRQPHKELNSVDKKHEESGSAPVDRGANKEEIQDSITRRRENGLSTVHPNEQRRTRPLRCPDRAFKQATKRVVVAKEKPATRALIPVRSTDSAAPISKASNVYTSSTKASTRRRTVKPMSPRRTTGSTVLKKTLTITSVSSGQTTALLQDRKAVSHSVRSSSTPANFKSTRKKGYTSSNAITSKALPENTTGRRWPQKWPAVRNEKSRPSSSTLPWTSAKIRDPHPTEGKDRRKYIPQSTTKSHQQEAKSNTGDSAKAASNFAADFVTWVSFVGIRSAAPEGKRTVNVTSSAPVRDETFASKIKTPQNGTTAATPRATESVHVTLRHGSDVPDGATTELPERSTWNTDVTGKRVLAVASKNVGRTEAPDSITQGTSTRDRHPQETAREDNATENLESGTPALKSNPPNSTPAYPPNEKFRDIVNAADIVTPDTNLMSADAKLSTTDASSQPAGTVFSDRRAPTSVGLGKTGDLPLTTALPSTESLKTPSSPIEATHTRSTETHLNGIEEVPANILTTVDVTRETISYGDSQLAKTEVNLPILTTPLPSTTTLTTAPKIPSESDSKVFLNTPKEEPTASNTEFTHATTASPAKTRTSAPDESYTKTTLNEERDLLFPSVRTEIGMTTSRSQETEASILSQTVTGATLPRTSETQSVYYQYTTFSLMDTPTYSKVQEARTTKPAQGLPAQTDIEAGTLGSDHPQSTSLNNALSTVKGVIETTTFAPAIVTTQASFPEEESQCQQLDCASTTGVGTASPIPPEGTPPKSDSPTTVPSEAEELERQLSKDSETAEKPQEAEQRGEEYEKNSVPRSTPSSTEDSNDYPHSIFPTEAGTSSAMSTKQNFEATSATDTKENSNSSFVTSSVPHITIVEADNFTPAITSPTGTEIFRNQKEVAAPHNAATTDISTFTGVPLETTIVENVAANANLTSTTPNGGPGSPRVLSENDAPEVSIAMNGSKPSESDGISNKSTLAVLTTPHGVFELPLKTEEPGESDRQLLTTLKLPTAHKEREALHTLGLEVTTDISNSTNFPQQETGNTYREGPRSDSSDTPNSATLSSQADSWETLTLSKTSLKNAEKPFLSSSTTSLQFEREDAVQENVEAEERGTTEQGLVTVTQAGFPNNQPNTAFNFRARADGS
ncbi:hypothetical protein HPB48_026431 [Haemaphysalis longicornis]|uniref:Chitin-binding type-2 domain-containing protein n=1 Tax=Haemaphysalis longicornis TaxID=44386 RepID=A0A9J6HC13_HAELO|nr:hypothetical protein HPB48_026431 [Haemaphysalis longicornis]